MKEYKESYTSKIVENGVTLEDGLKPALQLSIPDVEEFDHSVFDLATGTADYLKTLSPIDGAKFLVIEYDQDITIKLNATGNDPIVLNAYGTPAAGKFSIMSEAITDIYFTNSSGTTAKIKMLYGY